MMGAAAVPESSGSGGLEEPVGRASGGPWTESTSCRVMLDMMLTDRHEETFGELDESQIAATIAGSGAEVATIWFKDENGFCAYPTQIGAMHPRLAGRDFSGRLLAALRALGVRVVGYYCVGLDRRYAELHPTEQVVYSDGLPGFVPIPCLSSAYREHALRQLEEIVRSYSLDGLWLDVIWFPQKDFFPDPEAPRAPKSEAISCYCARCEEGYRLRGGGPIPRAPSEEAGPWRTWLAYKQAVLEGFLAEARARVRRVDPSVAFTHNLTVFNQHDGRGGLSWRSVRLDDWGSLEAYYPWTGHLQTSILPRMLRGIGEGRPFEVAILSHGELWDWTPKAVDQLTAEALTIAANGGAVVVDDHLLPSGRLQTPLYDRIAQVFTKVKRSQEWIRSSDSMKHLAVVYSERSRDLFGRGDPRRYQASFDGACRALIEAKIPFDVLPDEHLSFPILSRYRGILLPNVACMSDEACRAVGAAVRSGIGAVACGETSLYDELGDRRVDFGIRELGVHLAGGQVAAPHLFVEFGGEGGELAAGLTPDLAVNMKKPGLRVDGHGIGVGSLRLPMVWACNHFYRSYENPPGKERAGAAIWLGGAAVAPPLTDDPIVGRTVFFPIDIAASYGEFTVPEARSLLINALRFAAGEPEIEVIGPDSVEAIYLEQDEPLRAVVHLINFPSTTGRSALIGGRVESVQAVSGIPPAHDLELVLRGALLARARSVRSVSSGDLEWAPGRARVALPPIAIHDVVVIELS